MVRIRLRRIGSKAQPSYRIIAANKEAPRDGGFLEILGSYNPRTEPATVELEEARIYDWMSKGAQPSDSAVQVFGMVGLMDRYARFKKGEPIETLLAEASAAAANRVVSPKTEQLGVTKKSKKAQAG